jgi:hypothetical protein
MPTYRATRDIMVEGLGRIRKGAVFTVSDKTPVHKSAEKVVSQKELEQAAIYLNEKAAKEAKEAEAAEKRAADAKAKADREREEADAAAKAAKDAEAKAKGDKKG